MIAGRHSEDFYPITWVGRVPVYITTILVAVYVVAFVVGAVLIGTGHGEWLAAIGYSSDAVIGQFHLWQFVTYPLLNSPEQGIWFAIEMLLLYAFGREVEKFLGRRSFALFYGALLLAPPIVLTVLGLTGLPTGYASSGALNFTVFVAFAVIYPNAEIFFSLKAKWIALVLLALYSVQYFAGNAWIPLCVLWLETVCAVTMLHFSGVTNASFDSWMPEREEPRPAKRRKKAVKAEEPKEDPHATIDPLLEKISREGIGSLTKKERARLEQARAALIEREKQSH